MSGVSVGLDSAFLVPALAFAIVFAAAVIVGLCLPDEDDRIDKSNKEHNDEHHD